MLNRATLIGNVGNDPEIRTMNNGKECANLSIATSEKWKDKQSGEMKEQTEWHRVVVFSEGLVRVIKEHVKKGSQLMVEGSIRTRKWTDQSGQEKYSTEIVLSGFSHQIKLLGKRGEGGANRPPPNEDAPENMADLDDEIPF